MGAGGLTLGLICPILHARGLETSVVSRIEASGHRERLERIRDRGSAVAATLRGASLPDIPVGTFLDIDEEDDRATLARQVAHPSTVLLVTAARDGVDTLVEPIRSACATRTNPLLALSADNDPPATWRSLERDPPAGMVVTRSIADRICLRFPRTLPGVDVLIEGDSAWYLEEVDSGAVGSLLKGPGTEIVEDFEQCWLRKYYCVNGLQFALAVLAWDEHPRLDTWIARNEERAQALGQELASAYAAISGDSIAEAQDRVRSSLDRFRRAPDRAGRMLGLDPTQE